MKNLVLLTSIVFSLGSFMATTIAHAADVVGRWQTIDDATGKPKSIVEIFRQGEEIKGRIVELINPSEPNPLCKECPGDKKNTPITGLEMMWSLRPSGEGQWSGGRILDPQKGKEYRATIRLIEGGQKLEVRGYVGISAIGRTQTWIRQE